MMELLKVRMVCVDHEGGLGQHLLIISFSSKCHVNYMRAGGSLPLFIKSTTKNNKQIEMILK